MDGWITIGTQLSTDKFDRQVADLEKKMQREENKKIVLGAKIEVQKEELEEARRKTDELADAYQRLEQLQKTISSGKATPQQFTMAQDIQNTYGNMTQLETSFLRALNKQDAIEQKAQQMKLRYDEINDRVSEYKQKIESVQLQRQVSDTEKLRKSFNQVGNSIENAIKKVGRLVLSIFSVRSAISLLSRASSDLAQYDEQYASNLEYIRYVLAQAVAPILKWIVNMVAKLLGFINAIWKALFGTSLIANNSAESFVKMKSNANKVTKAVKEIKKQLTGFDEINMLTDETDTGTKAGAKGVTPPSIQFEDVKLPEWLTKIIDWFKPLIEFFQKISEKYGPVVAAITAIVGALVGFLILKKIVSLFFGFGKALNTTKTNFTTFFDKIGTATIIIAILGGLALVIKEVTGLIDAFSKSGLSLGDVAILLASILGELALAFIAIAAASKTMSWQSIAGAAVILAGFALIINQVNKLLKTFSDTGMTVGDVVGLMASIFTPLVVLMGSVALLGPAMTAGLIPFLAIVGGISAILLVMSATLPVILDACSSFITATAPSIQAILETIGSVIETIAKALGETLPPIIESLGKLFTSIFDGISKVVTTLFDSVLGFIEKLGPAIRTLVDNVIGSITDLVNFVISAIEYLVNRVIDGINALAGLLNNVPRNKYSKSRLS